MSAVSFIVILLSIVMLVAQIVCSKRTASTVLSDLEENNKKHDNDLRKLSKSGLQLLASYNLQARVGIADLKVWVLVGVLFGIVFSYILKSMAGIFVYPPAFAGLAFIIGRAYYVQLTKKRIEDLEKKLPVVMERLVMAVQSGLDVLAGIGALVELDSRINSEQERDRVSELFSLVLSLVESGISFSEALQQVSQKIPSIALRHAFIHLAVAYEEGGELVVPLRELSEASQVYYQEAVDEQIARMPVLATAPLICTFAGLILVFITPPLLEVLHFVSDVEVPK